MTTFEQEVNDRLAANSANAELRAAAASLMTASLPLKYSYNFSWLGRPIIQYPQDIVAMQEVIWRTQPDLIIETGIAHGGSLILYASLLELNAACGGPADASVLGIDIDIRQHNRDAIEAHPMSRRIRMLSGSSIDADIVAQARAAAARARHTMVCLDSNHTHEHVLAELEAYAPLVSPGGYCVVFDTIVEQMPATLFTDRPWAPGNSPMTAVVEFLAKNPRFEVDHSIDAKLLLSVAPGGYLRRIAP